MKQEQTAETTLASRAPGVLHGLRIIEVGHFIAAPFGARLLADLGADLIKVEAQDGDSVRWPGPPIGAHNDEVYGALLGRSVEQLQALRAARVI